MEGAGADALLAALGELDVVAEPCLVVLARNEQLFLLGWWPYQSLKDTLSCGRTAGLDLPDVVLSDLLELQAV